MLVVCCIYDYRLRALAKNALHARGEFGKPHKR